VSEVRGPLLAELVLSALREDLGDGDVTSEATVPADLRARARIVQKAEGVIFGLEPALLAFRLMDPGLSIEERGPEGEWREAGAAVLSVSGDARALLAAERTALNFLGRLSGVATMSARAVAALAGTGARVLDTRKTTPGLRALEKAAVAAGGGTNHRAGLYDAVLIKENHIALAGGVGVGWVSITKVSLPTHPGPRCGPALSIAVARAGIDPGGADVANKSAWRLCSGAGPDLSELKACGRARFITMERSEDPDPRQTPAGHRPRPVRRPA